MHSLLRVPWTARKSNQSILKEINPEYSLEELMLKFSTLVTWCEEPTHWKRPWCWQRLRTGGEGADRMRWLDGIPDSMDVNWSKLWEMVKHSTGLCRVGHNLAREQQRQHIARYLLVTLSGSLSALWLMLQWARQCRDLSETLTVCPVGLAIGIRGDWFQNQQGYQHLKML